MSLSLELEKQVSAASGAPVNLAVREGQNHLVCELAATDSLGVSVRLLELRTPKLEGLASEKLRDVADDLSRRVSYLLEAIAPIEIDDEACVVQMRSTPPYRAENASSYYEVLVTAGTISLKRFSKSRGELRRPEAFDITRQVLYRLADDFAAAAAEV